MGKLSPTGWCIMSDLSAFLWARLAEDEAVAKGFYGATRFMGGEPDFYGQDGPAASAFWQHFTADRVLREVAVKREIVRRCAGHMDEPDQYPNGLVSPRALLSRQVLLNLAAVYSDHPDYREDWKP